MKITINPYRRRDGSVMIFINNDRKVSIGISPEKGWQSSKATAGETKLWEAFNRATREAEALATGADISAHDEWKLEMFNGVTFAMTDVAAVGGVSTGSDGLFVVRDGRVMARFFEVEG